MTSSEEREVIDRIRCGDTDAFEILVLDNQKKVYNLALKMTGNENDALDISQEAFIRAYTGLPKFRSDCRISVWLYRLTYNISIDFIRKKQRTQMSSLTYIDNDGECSDQEIPDLRYEPESAAEKRELSETINKGIEELPEKQREILLMREMTGMSYEDISLALGLNEGTVKSRLSRARKGLAQILNRYGTFSSSIRHKDARGVEGHD